MSSSIACLHVAASDALLVREVGGQYRATTSDEVLRRARYVLSRRIRRGASMDSPQAVKDFLRLRIGVLEHEMFSALYMNTQARFLQAIECPPMLSTVIRRSSIELSLLVSCRQPSAIRGWQQCHGSRQPACCARRQHPLHCSPRPLPEQWQVWKLARSGHSPTFLSGGTVIDGWVVPNLRGESATGPGRWSEDDIVAYLKSGRTDQSAVFGGMSDVVAWSTRRFDDTDLHSIAKYLKSLRAANLNEEPCAYDASIATLLASRELHSSHGADV